MARLLQAARDSPGTWARPGGDIETTAVAMRLIDLAALAWLDDKATVDFLRRSEDPVLGLCLAPGARTTSVNALWGGLDLARRLHVRLGYPRAVGASLARLLMATPAMLPVTITIATRKTSIIWRHWA